MCLFRHRFDAFSPKSQKSHAWRKRLSENSKTSFLCHTRRKARVTQKGNPTRLPGSRDVHTRVGPGRPARGSPRDPCAGPAADKGRHIGSPGRRGNPTGPSGSCLPVHQESPWGRHLGLCCQIVVERVPVLHREGLHAPAVGGLAVGPHCAPRATSSRNRQAGTTSMCTSSTSRLSSSSRVTMTSRSVPPFACASRTRLPTSRLRASPAIE